MNNFVAALQRFGIGRLAAVLGIGIGVAAALIALTMNLGEPKALLYSNLDLKEAGSITTALDQAGVKYEVKGDGSTIMVSRDQVASTRLMLDTMARTTSGPMRLKGGVPAGWSVAHKTGTGQQLGDMQTGYNDIGILTAPDGTRYAVAVMLAHTTAPNIDRMQFMQAISRTIATYHGR